MTAYLDQLFTSGWRALAELKAAGRIRGIGAGINELGMMPRFLDLVDIDFFLLAMRYTLLEQETLETELPRCAERGVGIVIGGVFNSGILATGAVPGAKYNYADATPEVMEQGPPDRGRVPAPRRAAGRRRPAVPARPSERRLRHPGRPASRPCGRNVAQFRLDIPAEFWAELKAEQLLHAEAPTPASDGRGGTSATLWTAAGHAFWRSPFRVASPCASAPWNTRQVQPIGDGPEPFAEVVAAPGLVAPP